MMVQNALVTTRGCTLSGCPGPCSGCTGRPPAARGMGDIFTDYLPDISALPAPFNNWYVILAIVAALLLTTGVFKFGRGRSSSGKSRALRMARLAAEEKRAHILQEA